MPGEKTGLKESYKEDLTGADRDLGSDSNVDKRTADDLNDATVREEKYQKRGKRYSGE